MQDLVLNVRDIRCEACEQRIGRALRGLTGVVRVAADHRTGTVRVVFEQSRTSETAIRATIEQIGYQVTS
jgi:copper chaperone CopZ